MTTTPMPTGKIRGSLRDVTPKLRNFVGAVKVTTPSGKGGILVEMGKTVAAYLTREGVLHRGKESLDLLEKEEMAEFEVIRYDEEQFREAMIICDNRGLVIAGEMGPDTGVPPRPQEPKPKEEENVLSAMMKRFAVPRIGEKQEPVRPAQVAVVPPPPAPGAEKEEPRPSPVQAPPQEKALPAQEKKGTSLPPPESELSAIIKRLRETEKTGKGTAPPEAKRDEISPKAVGTVPEGKARAAVPAAPEGEGLRPAGEEKIPARAAEPGAEVPGGQAPGGRVKVDLGKMMKRIKRLDITSIRQELQEGAEAAGGPAPVAAPEAPTPPGEGPAAPASAPAEPTPRAAEARERSDIDELKAFIKRIEVLEGPGESPPAEKGVLARLGVKPAKEEAAPTRREIPVPVPAKEKPPEEAAAAEEAKPLPRPPEEREAPRPAEPDRKAKIASLLRRSGLVKPLAEEPPKEPAAEIPVVPPIPEQKEEPTAPAREAEIRVPRPVRKKVEITRVPKKPEKPLREPPLLDERMIQRILKQPGVIAVSTFFEGFAVQSAGRADFEQVAANAEDLFRAGKKIAGEIGIGPLNQVILETGKGKLVIAPYGDLNVCIFTEPDANLGLIRVAIKSLQLEKG